MTQATILIPAAHIAMARAIATATGNTNSNWGSALYNSATLEFDENDQPIGSPVGYISSGHLPAPLVAAFSSVAECSDAVTQYNLGYTQAQIEALILGDGVNQPGVVNGAQNGTQVFELVNPEIWEQVLDPRGWWT